jgi:hypothetical protein
MTNAKQIRQVFKPLVERHEDLVALNGRWLWIKPVHHVGLRIYIDSTREADYASPRWNTVETFLFSTQVDRWLSQFGFHYMRDRAYTGKTEEKNWQWSDPTMLGDLIAFIENEALPFLRSLDTLEKYVAFTRATFDRDQRQLHLPEDRMIVDVALGDLDVARKACLDLLPKFREELGPESWPYNNRRTKIVTLAEPLLAGDRQALAAILHGWEADNMRGTKLEPHWEPTPFPLELA